MDLTYLWYTLLTLVPLLLLQRSLHFQIQAIIYLITRRVDITIVLFSLLFFPGILIHEGSHFLTARLLGVRTGRFSVLPRSLGDGRLQLGYVETAQADPFREAIIGLAPLLAGGAFVAYGGLVQLGLLSIWETLGANGVDLLRDVIPAFYAQADFWLWFYLTLVVSSTMMPSASDRRAWIPLVLFAVLLVGLAILVGAGPWMLANLADPLNMVFLALAIVFGISILVHALLLLPSLVLKILLSWITGSKID